MVDLPVAQGGVKLGDGKYDSCTERFETRGWLIRLLDREV